MRRLLKRQTSSYSSFSNNGVYPQGLTRYDFAIQTFSAGITMLGNRASYRLPVIIAVVAHFLLITMLFVSFTNTQFRWNTTQKKPAVTAIAVDNKQVEQQIKKIQAEQLEKQQAEKRQVQALEHKALLARKRRQQEEKRLHDLKIAQQKLEQQRLAAQRAAKQAAQKKAELVQQQKKKQQETLAAQQQMLQQKRLAQQMKSEQQQLLAQQRQLQTVQQRGQIDKYRARILQLVQGNWHPLEQNPRQFCLVIAHLAPGGVVTAVDIAQSSGDAALDRSAQVAIYKSSPLPVPEDPELFDAFRSLRIKMSPQEIQ